MIFATIPSQITALNTVIPLFTDSWIHCFILVPKYLIISMKEKDNLERKALGRGDGCNC